MDGRSEFWQQLLDAGVLDEDLANEFDRAANAAWTPIGKLLVQSGALSMAQLMSLLGMQADEPYVRLGDLAIREGFCDLEQIRGAVEEQQRSCPHPVELLLADSRIDNGTLFGPLIDYMRWLESRLNALEHARVEETR